MDEPIAAGGGFERFDTGEMARQLMHLNRLGERFGRTMSRAFVDVAIRGRSFGDVLRGLGRQLAQLALRAATKSLENAVGALFQNVFAGGFGTGAALRGGGVVPFAQGGVVAAPTFFPLAGGRVGLMGERGAEAIMPLARGADGRLGVRASGAAPATQVTFNVTTPDVEGFRRSQSQIAALLSRTVSQGQRNL